MLIFFVFLVSLNIPMIRTEESKIAIYISKDGTEAKCNVSKEVRLARYSNFTLEIKSEYFITESTWLEKREKNREPIIIANLSNSNLSIIYQRNIGSDTNNITNKFIYSFSHTENAPMKPVSWTFEFKLLKEYDPWLVQNWTNVQDLSCSTSVVYQSSEGSSSNPENSNGEAARGFSDNTVKEKHWFIIVVAVIGALLLAQTSYIVCGKVRGRKSKGKNNDKDPISPKSPKAKRGSISERNIADRPPLALPPDEVLKDVTSAPPENAYKCQPGPLAAKQSLRNKGFDNSDDDIRSPGFPRRHMEGPAPPKQSYRNKALDNSDEDLRSPGFSRRHEGPSAPKQSYRNKALVNSDEDLRSPGFARRHEGPSAPKQSYRNKALDNSDEDLRSPGFARRHEGPLVPKQLYKNRGLKNSDEDLSSPGFGRRQEAKLAQLPPKGVCPSKSFKIPKPLPRTTSSSPPPLEKPAFLPAQAQEPSPPPPLLPKKVTFPTQEACRPQDSRRFSDDEWQYEKLQPACKYLDKFTNEPYL